MTYLFICFIIFSNVSQLAIYLHSLSSHDMAAVISKSYQGEMIRQWWEVNYTSFKKKRRKKKLI